MYISKINKIAKKYKLKVIEDAAQSFEVSKKILIHVIVLIFQLQVFQLNLVL